MPASFAEVSINRAAGFQPKAALVIQGEKAHDVASFVHSVSALPQSLPDGTPVQIHFGREGAAQQRFVGYIHHTEPVFTDDQTRGRLKVVCIGASWSLMSGLQRIWHHQSLDTIVREVAQEAYLSADVEPHTVRWPYISANTSAWEFLLELADKIGYTLSCNGTEVKFISPAEALKRAIRGAPSISHRVFHPVVGAASEAGRKVQKIGFGIDPRTARLFSAAGGEAGEFLEIDTQSSLSPEEAAVQVSQRQRFVYQATAEADGDARITQASVVYVPGVSFDYAGHWYVHRVEHDIRDDGEYAVHLQLGKDARGAYAQTPSQGAGLRIRTDPYGEVTGNPPPSVLVSRVWRSGWARRAS